MRSLYVDVRGEHVFALFHLAAGETGPAVLLCPPFGREDAASYRSRRAWAALLANAGMPTLRFDLPGTGDSGGEIDEPGRFESWVETVGALAEFLRIETGRPRTAALGIGLGGMVAAAAVAGGAPIDDLVLWGVPAHGRMLVRELTTFARIESASIIAAGGPPPPDDPSAPIAPGGFLFPRELGEALHRVDLTTLADCRLDGTRALLLGRDGIPPDPALVAAIHASGADVDVADGPGFADMMTVLPEAARLPHRVSDHVAAWLESDSLQAAGERPAGEQQGPASPHAELLTDGRRLRETPLEIVRGSRRLFGILAEPLDVGPVDTALLLLNAGAIRRTGPSRMWVDVARRWAGRGVPTLRIDVAGIGDASEAGVTELTVPDLYAEEYVGQVRAAIDVVAARTGARKVVLLGLCAGAYWAFHAALADDRVRLAVMLNPRLLFWDAEIRDAYDARNRRRNLLRIGAWRRFGRVHPLALPRRAATVVARLAAEPLRRAARRRAHREARSATIDAFDRLEASGTSVVVAFCEGEPLRDDLAAAGVLSRTDRWSNVEFVDLPGRDHVLRPVWMHPYVHDAVDEAIGSEVELRANAST
ncbi:MAG TPA: hypothetical protein VGI77_07230 [Gaiellaceae bacterium]|jgi:alpha-beta hydrolase superfamily lysophospholipase